MIRTRRRRRPLLVAAGGVLALVLVGLLAWFVVVPAWRPGLRAGEAHAIDVSNHQGTIDWAAVRADGIDVAYLKATEGRGYLDSSFAANWSGTAAAGVRRGAYHFFTLCASGADQAANFLRVAPPAPDALPPALDLELLDDGCHDRPDPAAVEAELATFIERVEAAWGGPLLLYARSSFTARYPVTTWADRPRWQTRFFRRPVEPFALWQVHYLARVDGIAGRVDLDVATPQLLAPG